MTSGVGGTGESLGHSACGWRPVGCQLTRGTSLFPIQSWQDSCFIFLQPQPAEIMFPSEPRATGQSTGDFPRGREGREGQFEHPGWHTAVGHPAPRLVVFTSGSLWPRRPQHVTGGGG